jgi:chromosome segregation ATPase
MKRTSLTVGVILAIFGFGGCASMTECNDPGKGGFIGGVCGLASGNYDRRIEEREQNLAALKQAQSSASTKQTRLESEKKTAAQQLAALQQQAREIDNEAADLQRQINALQVKSSHNQNKKVALQKRLQQFRQQMATQKASLSQAGDEDIARYQAEEKRLLKELEMLKDEMYML